ncbi:hypothetical protein BDK51DRAFT_38475 [Blyttiomyces helicus]|uniref:Uncharacterized protein n=1 Tax=Blyttiomyces helicus TaxID=388810 RepID=A0A4P9VZZ7_9FUNG|nr:hypothetical protein BDK51DRAFT_38475 [Blyttiomyces helicus]|eukprot:RKO84942.1 hypothetical protein BDK51DRAFT_38475 [Blyttiomyces helicus]
MPLKLWGGNSTCSIANTRRQAEFRTADSSCLETLSRDEKTPEGVLGASSRKGAAPPLPLGELGSGCSARGGGGKVELVGDADAERVEGVHEFPRGGVVVEESGLVVGEAKKEAVEGDLAVPVEHLLEDVVVEHAGRGVKRREELARQLRVAGRVDSAEGVRPRHDGHNLHGVEAHAGQVVDSERGRVGGEGNEVVRVRAGLKETTGEVDGRAAADFDGGDGGKVDGVRDGDGGVGVALGEELMGHVCKEEALVAVAIELVDDAAVKAEGEVALEPCAY